MNNLLKPLSRAIVTSFIVASLLIPSISYSQTLNTSSQDQVAAIAAQFDTIKGIFNILLGKLSGTLGAQVSGGSSLANDTFTDGNNVLLQNHTTDSGHTWVRHPSYSTNAVISGNIVKDQNGTSPVYYLNITPSTAEYDIQMDVTGTGYVGGPAGRISITADTYYFIDWAPSSWRLNRTVNGSNTVIGSYSGDSPSGSVRTVRLEVKNATKKVFINGVERISSTDNNITAVGKPGIVFSGVTSDTGDNFIVTESGTTTPPPSDTTAPSIPTGLSATAVSTSQINLSWSASTDNVGVTGYNIYRGGSQIAAVANTSYNDTGLVASTAYSYTVDAYDAAGKISTQSASVSATTQGTTTPPPTPLPTVSLSASATSVTSGSSSTLTWSSTNATSCTASGGWSGTQGTSGSQTLTNLTTTGTYTLSCTGGGGTTQASATVTVTSATPPPPPTSGIFYISPSGSDTNSGTTSGAPFKTFAKAFSTMTGGNELILLNGVYGTAQGTGYISYLGTGSAQPPSGTSSSNLTVVRALNPGSVTVNGELFIGRSTRKDSYIKIQGITFEGGGSLYNTSFVTVKDSGFHGSFGIGTNDHDNGNDYDLIEDVWIWASGERIIAINYRSHHNVWRRVVVRGDGCGTSGCNGSGNPNVGITVYNSMDVSVQNVIVVDRILAASDEPYGDFAVAQHAPGPNFGRAEWLGTISLKAPDTGYYMEPDVGGTVDPTIKISNAVAWDAEGEGFNIARSGTNNLLENLTAYGRAGDSVRVAPELSGGTLRNVISSNSGRYGINSAYKPSYVDVYNARSSAYNQTTCSTGCYTSNPQADGATPSLKYITRVESGSLLNGKGAGGADIGANVLNRYGNDGSRFGESSYNTLTSTTLWPWPNEARIKTEMCANTTRGFCSTGKRLDGVNNVTLTSYIWEALGNSIPSSVYGGTTTPPPTPLPTVSLSASATSVTSGSSSTLTWSSTNATSCTASGGWSGTQGTSGSQTLTNLTTTGTYTLSCTGGGGTTQASATVTVTSATPPPPPSSTKFSLNDRVQVSSGPLNVRATASASGTLLGSQATGNLGTVIGGPVSADGLNWWNVNYDNAPDGWSAEDYLVKYTTTTPPPSTDCSATSVRCVDDTAGATQEYSTIQLAVTAAVAGDTVLVYGGTYRGFVASKSGTATNRITIKTTGEIVTINQTNTNNEGITISNASYITIEGFTIAGMPSYGFATHGASATNPMRGIIIRNNTVQNSGFVNLYTSNTADSTIEGNITSGSATSHGIYVANGGSDNVIVRGNRAFNNAKNGIHFNGDVSVGGDGYHTGLLVENNVFYNNTSNGFDIDGVGDSTFQNNLAYGNGTNAFRAFQIDAGTGIRNLKIINNTFITPGSGVPIKITEDLGGHTIFNNILITGGSNGSLVTSNTNFKSANNAVNGTFSLNGGNTLASLASWQGSGYDTNSFTTTSTALFTNVAGGDYTLKSGSTAIDKGVSIFNGALAPTTDIVGVSRQGVAYDAGAYEYASGTTTPPPPPPSDTTIPSQPANLSATAVSSSQINLSWSASTDNVGVTGYDIYRNSAFLITVTGTSYSNTGLTSNTTYSYYVRAKDAAGNPSPQSASVSVATQTADTTLPTITITSPTSATTYTTTTNFITPSGTASDNVGVTQVTWSNSTGGSGTGSGTTSWTATIPLQAGSNTITVAARDQVGNTGTDTITVTYTVLDTTVPSVSLSSPASGAIISGTATVSATASDNIGVTGVQFKLDGANLGAEDTASPYSVLWNTTTVANGTHTLIAVARDAGGNVTTSGSVLVTVSNTSPDTTIPSTPGNLTATAVSSSQITLSWTASTDPIVSGQTTSGLSSYRIYRNNIQIATTTGTSYNNTGLSPSTTYTYTIAAYDGAGNTSAQSSGVSVNTQAVPVVSDTTAPVITAVSAANITLSSATITWNTNELGTSHASYGTNSATLNQQVNGTSFVTAHTLSLMNLTRRTTYSYKVSSSDTSNNTATSSTLTFTTSSGKPSKVKNLSASQGSVILSWDMPKNDFIREIKIYRATTNYPSMTDMGALITTLPSSAITYRDDSTSSKTTYYYTVYTIDDLGVTSDPEYISFTTPGQSSGTTSGGGSAPPSSGTSTGSGGVVTPPQTSTTTIPPQTGTTTTPPSTSTPSTPSQTFATLTGPFGIGQRGDQVKLLQEMLAQDGVFTGEATGYYGPLTQRAVETFQTKYNLVTGGSPSTTGYGLAGPGTRAKLNSLYVGGSAGGMTPSTDREALLASLRKQVAELTAILQTLIAKLAALKAAQGVQ